MRKNNAPPGAGREAAIFIIPARIRRCGWCGGFVSAVDTKLHSEGRSRKVDLVVLFCDRCNRLYVVEPAAKAVPDLMEGKGWRWSTDAFAWDHNRAKALHLGLKNSTCAPRASSLPFSPLPLRELWAQFHHRPDIAESDLKDCCFG